MTSHDICLLSSPTPEAPRTLELAASLYLPTDSSPSPKADTLTGTVAAAGNVDHSFGPPGSPARFPALVVGHGAGSNRTRHAAFCEQACAAGFVVLGLDFRGHGDSRGSADGPLELDLCAAADYLRTLPEVDASQICYRGSSLGGFYGLKAAPMANFAAMALLCPATETVILHGLTQELENRDSESNNLQESDNLQQGDIHKKPARWDIPQMRAYFTQQRSLELARLVACPVLLVHTREDEVVPFTHTLLLAQSLLVDTTVLLLAEGTHTASQHDPRVQQSTLAWLREHLATNPV